MIFHVYSTVLTDIVIIWPNVYQHKPYMKYFSLQIRWLVKAEICLQIALVTTQLKYFEFHKKITPSQKLINQFSGIPDNRKQLFGFKDLRSILI